MSAVPVLTEAGTEEVITYERSLSWLCAFCPKLRIYEGGRPGLFNHLEICGQCGSRVATASKDRTAIAALIDQHLL